MTPKIAIHSESAPQAIGAYSQAIKSGNTLYLSGQIPLDPRTMQIVSGDFIAQLRQTFTNIGSVCAASGGSLRHIVKLTIYLMDLGHFNLVNQVMQEYFDPPYPARAVIGVSALPKNAEVEVEAIMVIE